MGLVKMLQCKQNQSHTLMTSHSHVCPYSPSRLKDIHLWLHLHPRMLSIRSLAHFRRPARTILRSKRALEHFDGKREWSALPEIAEIERDRDVETAEETRDYFANERRGSWYWVVDAAHVAYRSSEVFSGRPSTSSSIERTRRYSIEEL